MSQALKQAYTIHVIYQPQAIVKHCTDFVLFKENCERKSGKIFPDLLTNRKCLPKTNAKVSILLTLLAQFTISLLHHCDELVVIYSTVLDTKLMTQR